MKSPIIYFSILVSIRFYIMVVLTISSDSLDTEVFKNEISFFWLPTMNAIKLFSKFPNVNVCVFMCVCLCVRYSMLLSVRVFA